MRTATTKRQLLDDGGYFYNFDHMMYVNREARKVFSIEFIQDHSEGDLEACINEPPLPSGEWHLYFVSEPSESVKRQLLAILEKQ